MEHLTALVVLRGHFVENNAISEDQEYRYEGNYIFVSHGNTRLKVAIIEMWLKSYRNSKWAEITSDISVQRKCLVKLLSASISRRPN